MFSLLHLLSVAVLGLSTVFAAPTQVAAVFERQVTKPEIVLPKPNSTLIIGAHFKFEFTDDNSSELPNHLEVLLRGLLGPKDEKTYHLGPVNRTHLHPPTYSANLLVPRQAAPGTYRLEVDDYHQGTIEPFARVNETVHLVILQN